MLFIFVGIVIAIMIILYWIIFHSVEDYPRETHFDPEIGFYEIAGETINPCPFCGRPTTYALCWNGKIVGWQCPDCLKKFPAKTSASALCG